jgi:hypothetical protein
METITLNSHVGQDGILHLDIPVNIINTDLTITIILKPSDNFQQDNKQKEKVGLLIFLKKLQDV